MDERQNVSTNVTAIKVSAIMWHQLVTIINKGYIMIYEHHV